MPEVDEWPEGCGPSPTNDWYPGKKPSIEERKDAYILQLEKRIKEYEEAAILQSWKDNPDRMGR